jgi:hypothetical protein
MLSLSAVAGCLHFQVEKVAENECLGMSYSKGRALPGLGSFDFRSTRRECEMNALAKIAISIGSVALIAGCAGMTESFVQQANFIAITVLGSPEAVKTFTASLSGKNLATCQKVFPRGDESPLAAKANVPGELQIIFRCDRSAPPETFGVFGTAYGAGAKDGALRLTMSPVAAFTEEGCATGCTPTTCGGSTTRCFKTKPILCFSGVCQ